MTCLALDQSYAVVMCEIKLFQNYVFSFRRRPTGIILFQRMETCLKLFQNYFLSHVTTVLAVRPRESTSVNDFMSVPVQMVAWKDSSLK